MARGEEIRFVESLTSKISTSLEPYYLGTTRFKDHEKFWTLLHYFWNRFEIHRKSHFAFTYMPFRPLDIGQPCACRLMNDHLIPSQTTHPNHLNRLQDYLLEFSLNLLSRLVSVRLAVQVEKSAQIELGCL